MTTEPPIPPLVDEPLIGAGGLCAPMATGRWDIFEIAADLPDPAILLDIGPVVRGKVMDLADVRSLVNAKMLGQEDRAFLFDAVTGIAVTEYLAARARRPVHLSFPTVTAPRGGIRYLDPNAPRPKAPSKARRALSSARQSVRRFRDARARLADAGAVWRGTKTAHTDAELEALSEY